MILKNLDKGYKYVIYLTFKFGERSGFSDEIGMLIFLNFYEKDNESELKFLVLNYNSVGIHKRLSRKMVSSIFEKLVRDYCASFTIETFLYRILSIRDEDIPAVLLWKEKR